MKEPLQNKQKSNIGEQIMEKACLNYFIIIASIIICLPLLNKNLNIYIDDGIQHVCRLIGNYQTLTSGQFLPMIMSNFCNNFGYSWNIFYSPFTAYAPLIFKIFNFSFTNCLKIFIFAITVLSGVTMYKFVLRITKNKHISTLASILYILAPYRLTDMYIRVAIAELASFIFLPMVFEGLYVIVNENKKTYLLAWGAIGLILTHTVITLYTAILCFIYLVVFLIRRLPKKSANTDQKNKETCDIKNVLINLLKNIAFAVLVTSFYWVPLIQHYFATSYEVFVPGRMERVDVLKSLKVQFHELFITQKEQIMIFAIGLVQAIGLVLSPIALKKISKEYKKTYIIFLVFGIILTFMTLTFFPFEKLPNILTMLQFTFRLFEFTSFFFAFIAAINYGILIKNFKIRDVVILSIIALLLLIPYKSKLNYNLKYNEKSLIEPRRVTQNTGRVHADMASMEYLPSKAFNCLKTYIANRKDEPIIVNPESSKIKTSNGENNTNFESGLLAEEAKILDYQKDGSNMQFKITHVNTDIEIELPYIYYLGYRVYVNEKEVPYVESENGFVHVKIIEDFCNNGIADVKVKYVGTNEMIISFIVSIVALAILMLVNLYLKLLKISL